MKNLKLPNTINPIFAKLKRRWIDFLRKTDVFQCHVFKNVQRVVKQIVAEMHERHR